MSGVFLIVAHDEQYDNPTVLRSTSGGYPHIMLFYSGKNIDSNTLVKLAYNTFPLKKTTFTLTSENAKMNSFHHEKKGKQRYDVLLHLSDEDKDFVQNMRQVVLAQLSDFDRQKLSMNPPHVTHSIHWSEAEAQTALEQVKKHLPLDVTVTGYTID